MSYGINNSQCHACEKKETCTDRKAIEEAVTKIHSNTYETGHQGGGTVTLHCTRQIAINAYK